MIYTIQVSNHPNAGARIPSASVEASWNTVYDGHIATAADARHVVDDLSLWYRHIRAFRGRNVGKLWYAVLRIKDR